MPLLSLILNTTDQIHIHMNMESRVAFVENKMPPSRQQIVPVPNTLFKRDNWLRNLTKNKSLFAIIKGLWFWQNAQIIPDFQRCSQKQSIGQSVVVFQCMGENRYVALGHSSGHQWAKHKTHSIVTSNHPKARITPTHNAVLILQLSQNRSMNNQKQSQIARPRALDKEV